MGACHSPGKSHTPPNDSPLFCCDCSEKHLDGLLGTNRTKQIESMGLIARLGGPWVKNGSHIFQELSTNRQSTTKETIWYRPYVAWKGLNISYLALNQQSLLAAGLEVHILTRMSPCTVISSGARTTSCEGFYPHPPPAQKKPPRMAEPLPQALSMPPSSLTFCERTAHSKTFPPRGKFMMFS